MRIKTVFTSRWETVIDSQTLPLQKLIIFSILIWFSVVGELNNHMIMESQFRIEKGSFLTDKLWSSSLIQTHPIIWILIWNMHYLNSLRYSDSVFFESKFWSGQSSIHSLQSELKPISHQYNVRGLIKWQIFLTLSMKFRLSKDNNGSSLSGMGLNPPDLSQISLWITLNPSPIQNYSHFPQF